MEFIRDLESWRRAVVRDAASAKQGSHDDVIDAVQKAAAHYEREMHYPFATFSLTTVSLWEGSKSLRTRVNDQIETLQLAVSEWLDSCVARQDERKFDAAMASLTKLLALIGQNDPIFERGRMRRLGSWLADRFLPAKV